MKKICEVCNKEFEADKRNYSRQKRCSDKCRWEVWNKKEREENKERLMQPKTCLVCDTEFIPSNVIGASRQLFCSAQCKAKKKLRTDMEERNKEFLTRPTYACAICNKFFVKRDERQMHCSKQCGLKANGSTNTRNYRLKSFGMPKGVYPALLEKQEFRCAICKIHRDDYHKEFSIDHCHSTNKFRGLLCQPCNVALGHFKDNTQTLQSAINYLTTN